MPVALIAAGVTAAASIGGALISSSGNKHAAQIAQDTANTNNQVAADARDKNTAILNPFVQRGNAAGDTFNALLGIGGGSGTQPAAQQDAFNAFAKSDGYQFRVNEGTKALNTGYAANGLIQSGAAMKGINAFAQNQASDEFGKYMGYVGNQQAVGLNAGNALAGQNSIYANQVTNNNNSAGSAAANAQIANSNAWTGALGGVANAFGTYAGTQSSYGGGGGGAGRQSRDPFNYPLEMSVNNPGKAWGLNGRVG